VQPDTTRTTADGLELDHYKRVVIDGIVEDIEGKDTFDAILDMRARLFSVGVRVHSLDYARYVGNAIVKEMAAFVPYPVSKLLVEVPQATARTRAEWMVVDPNHVAGLLHRLQQGGTFVERERAPTPDPLGQILEDLDVSITMNADLIEGAWDGDALDRHKVLLLDTETWQVHQSRFLELCDDSDMRRDMAIFFAEVADFRRLWEIAISGDGGPHPASAEAWKNRLVPDATRHLKRLRVALTDSQWRKH
jgi:hypothetical protein